MSDGVVITADGRMGKKKRALQKRYFILFSQSRTRALSTYQEIMWLLYTSAAESRVQGSTWDCAQTDTMNARVTDRGKNVNDQYWFAFDTLQSASAGRLELLDLNQGNGMVTYLLEVDAVPGGWK